MAGRGLARARGFVMDGGRVAGRWRRGRQRGSSRWPVGVGAAGAAEGEFGAGNRAGVGDRRIRERGAAAAAVPAGRRGRGKLFTSFTSPFYVLSGKLLTSRSMRLPQN